MPRGPSRQKRQAEIIEILNISLDEYENIVRRGTHAARGRIISLHEIALYLEESLGRRDAQRMIRRRPFVPGGERTLLEMFEIFDLRYLLRVFLPAIPGDLLRS